MHQIRHWLAMAAVITGTAAAPASGAGQEIDGADAAAADIAETAAAFLASQPAIAFDWSASFDVVVEGREKITYFQSGANRMLRGSGVFARFERGDHVREYFHDGTSFTVAAPYEDFYASAAFAGSYDELLAIAREQSDRPVAVWQLMSPTLAEDPLAEVTASAYLGTTLIEGEEAHHLAFSEHDEDWQIWISTDPDRPVPLMYVSTDPYTQGWPQYRARFTNWRFELTEDEAVFTFEPDEDDIRITMPALDAALGAASAGTEQE
ncbi:hypothetical protein LNKW23_27570 [Paralimibaculum aggregatum]|uniref:DUF2092 domain-containing protein n=1 Tax=Paralimibaculum aggregatum TaxID=3036245 RepID=A0ABQ6LMM3_9RHOB|nr:DUF2092 domain-containing protein [Limibaculum sp. NKW23]GMG83544.1 hypothetical protein LNKW23_27570 [Limibaculum sp. NKW23]